MRNAGGTAASRRIGGVTRPADGLLRSRGRASKWLRQEQFITPEEIELMTAALDDAVVLANGQRSSAVKVRFARRILASAAEGERNVTLSNYEYPHSWVLAAIIRTAHPCTTKGDIHIPSMQMVNGWYNYAP